MHVQGEGNGGAKANSMSLYALRIHWLELREERRKDETSKEGEGG